MSVYRIQNLLSTLRVDADFDSVTGLAWRERFWADAQRLFSSRDQKYVMVYLNIERFEVLNDLFGQSMGDQVLRVLGGSWPPSGERHRRPFGRRPFCNLLPAGQSGCGQSAAAGQGCGAAAADEI